MGDGMTGYSAGASRHPHPSGPSVCPLVVCSTVCSRRWGDAIAGPSVCPLVVQTRGCVPTGVRPRRRRDEMEGRDGGTSWRDERAGAHSLVLLDGACASGVLARRESVTRWRRVLLYPRARPRYTGETTNGKSGVQLGMFLPIVDWVQRR